MSCWWGHIPCWWAACQPAARVQSDAPAFGSGALWATQTVALTQQLLTERSAMGGFRRERQIRSAGKKLGDGHAGNVATIHSPAWPMNEAHRTNQRPSSSPMHE